jgi:hypothetical protein
VLVLALADGVAGWYTQWSNVVESPAVHYNSEEQEWVLKQGK